MRPLTESGPVFRAGRFRALMGSFPTGVAVVTGSEANGRPTGMTCSSVCSVSMDPPMLLVSLRRASPTLDTILRTGTFAVNLLHDNAAPVAELFASGSPDRFDRVQWQTEAGGPHLTDDAHAVADCQVVRAEDAADHAVVYGQVYRVHGPDGRHPLLYGLQTYVGWPAVKM